MVKKTTKKNQTKVSHYKTPCPLIDQFLLIKKLTPNEAKDLYERLKTYVKTDKPTGVADYVQTLINELLVDPNSITPFITEDNITVVLKEVYECIVDIYVAFRIEVICADLNDLPITGPFDPTSLLNFDWLSPTSSKQSTPSRSADDVIRQILADSAPSASPKAAKKAKRDSNSVMFLNSDDLQDIEDHLKKNVIGQDEAISSLMNRLKLITVGFDKRGVFFFIGRTGVGKTQLAKLFGKRYCGNFAKINCAEYSHGHEISKLIGAPPGYIGSSQSSFFKDKAEVSNRWVFLFDEIEKANDKLFNLLLSLLDDGTITDSGGNTLDFTNSIFIFTSNQGISDIKESSLGFGNKGPSQDAINQTLKDSLGKKFSPEFRNRIDEFIYFNDLTSENVSKIAKLHLKEYPIEITDDIVDHVVKNAYSREFGVRELKRFIKNSIGIFLANCILDGYIPITGAKYKLGFVDGKLTLENCVQVPLTMNMKNSPVLS